MNSTKGVVGNGKEKKVKINGQTKHQYSSATSCFGNWYVRSHLETK